QSRRRKSRESNVAVSAGECMATQLSQRSAHMSHSLHVNTLIEASAGDDRVVRRWRPPVPPPVNHTRPVSNRYRAPRSGTRKTVLLGLFANDGPGTLQVITHRPYRQDGRNQNQ